jgi:hypothetical protein
MVLPFSIFRTQNWEKRSLSGQWFHIQLEHSMNGDPGFSDQPWPLRVVLCNAQIVAWRRK